VHTGGARSNVGTKLKIYKNMIIYLESDHAGFEMKNILADFLREEKYDVRDCDTKISDHNDDYPEHISVAAREVSKDPKSKAVVLGGSGQGEAIVANRFPNVRAAVYYGGSLDIVKLSREHNDANILSLGARFLSVDEAKEAVRLWLNTAFSGEERHVRRIKEIEEVLKHD
jgi:ribose 5-phosphate isomerase B